MGIHGLLPFLKNASHPTNIKEFKGCTVAIDSYCWLHRGAFACAEKLALGEKTDQYVYYCMKYVNNLLSFGIKPIMVFDGCRLPSKQEVEKARRERRAVNRKKAAQLLLEGKRSEARDCLAQCIDVTPHMALELIRACREKGVDCIVAPYEADAQLAFLCKIGIAQVVITEDSDLVLFGCERIMFKMDVAGNGILVEQRDLNKAMGLHPEAFTFDKFRYACILSGCDYLGNLPGIGLAKATKVFKLSRQADMATVIRKIPSTLKMPNLQVPVDYVEAFFRANNSFLYQLVYDPLRRKLVPLNAYPDDIDPTELRYAGPCIAEDKALQIALGNINVNTGERIDDFDPDTFQPKSSSWNDTVRPLHLVSIWSREYRPMTTRVESTRDLRPVERPDTRGKQVTVELSRLGHKLNNNKRQRTTTADAEDSCVLPSNELVALYSHNDNNNSSGSSLGFSESNGADDADWENPEKKTRAMTPTDFENIDVLSELELNSLCSEADLEAISDPDLPESPGKAEISGKHRTSPSKRCGKENVVSPTKSSVKSPGFSRRAEDGGGEISTTGDVTSPGDKDEIEEFKSPVRRKNLFAVNGVTSKLSATFCLNATKPTKVVDLGVEPEVKSRFFVPKVPRRETTFFKELRKQDVGDDTAADGVINTTCAQTADQTTDAFSSPTNAHSNNCPVAASPVTDVPLTSPSSSCDKRKLTSADQTISDSPHVRKTDQNRKDLSEFTSLKASLRESANKNSHKSTLESPDDRRSSKAGGRAGGKAGNTVSNLSLFRRKLDQRRQDGKTTSLRSVSKPFKPVASNSNNKTERKSLDSLWQNARFTSPQTSDNQLLSAQKPTISTFSFEPKLTSTRGRNLFGFRDPPEIPDCDSEDDAPDSSGGKNSDSDGEDPYVDHRRHSVAAALPCKPSRALDKSDLDACEIDAVENSDFDRAQQRDERLGAADRISMGVASAMHRVGGEGDVSYATSEGQCSSVLQPAARISMALSASTSALGRRLSDSISSAVKQTDSKNSSRVLPSGGGCRTSGLSKSKRNRSTDSDERQTAISKYFQTSFAYSKR